MIPVTYLFINRNVIHNERPRPLWAKGLVALAWGVTYGVLLGAVFAEIGILVGLAIGVYSFFA